MKKKNRNNESGGGDEWLTTYSDLVTLLFAFFVLLFSFSTVDAAKWKEIVLSFTGKQVIIQEEGASDSLLENSNIMFEQQDAKEDDEEDEEDEEEEGEEAAGEEDDGEAKQGEEEEGIDAQGIAEEGDDELAEQIKNADEEDEEKLSKEEKEIIDKNFESLYNALVQHNINEGMEFEIMKSESEIRIRLSNNLLFAPCKADLSTESCNTLKYIAVIIKDYNDTLDKIVTEGNTDNVPIHTEKFRDNFELSLERALEVLYYLKYDIGLEPKKLMPLGYGEYNPISDNDTLEGRAKNRRTDIVLVKRTKKN